MKNVRDDIIEKCEKLILEKGANETSIKDIVKETGISKGTLYYYFPSKEALIEAVTENYIARTQESIDQMVEQLSAGLKIETIVTSIIDTVGKQKETARLHYVLTTYGLTSDPAVADKIRARYDVWLRQIQGALDGYKPLKYNAMFSNLILACVDGFALRSVLGASGETNVSEIMELIGILIPFMK